ncbi:hypothetical protein J5W01_00465 [Akkermansia muciniphila]|nr:hypothetical protein [Candidatus Akkermansia timonensis]MBT9561429.1 hypothetical protein [Candidatus Akkermansia timonensis]MBT9599690.1 hypothetical protein [Akkermansia muciniphila]
MDNTQIQIQFPSPGAWEEFTMTAVFPDKDGFVQSRRYTQDEIPADQAPAMAAVVAALVGLAEPWQASQVWARLGAVCGYVAGEVMSQLVVELTVEAVNAQGGRRVFSSTDYPDFILTAPAAVAFFKHFTKQP